MPQEINAVSTENAQVFIVEDHPIVREGLRNLIDQADGMMVCGEADGREETMLFLKEKSPDLVIMDISLSDVNGLELIKLIKADLPDLPILVLSMHDEVVYAERVLRAGARGYIMKEEAANCFVTAIRKVLMGEIYLSEKMSSQLLLKYIDGNPANVESPVQRLTDRELEIFELIGRGLRNREIAERISLSIKTVESHCANIKTKLKLDNATQLIHAAVQWVHFENCR